MVAKRNPFQKVYSKNFLQKHKKVTVSYEGGRVKASGDVFIQTQSLLSESHIGLTYEDDRMCQIDNMRAMRESDSRLALWRRSLCHLTNRPRYIYTTKISIEK
jgi:hypothetical protein